MTTTTEILFLTISTTSLIAATAFISTVVKHETNFLRMLMEAKPLHTKAYDTGLFEHEGKWIFLIKGRCYMTFEPMPMHPNLQMVWNAFVRHVLDTRRISAKQANSLLS